MRILHTSDWHVGKTLRGESRLEEHRAVLGEIVEVATSERVDLVLVTGDLFESAAPSPDAKALVFSTLLALHGTGAKVVAIAGNHDHARELDAVSPVFEALGVTLLGSVVPPHRGGVIEHVTASGEHARIALLPFLSQRYAVRAEQLMERNAAQVAGIYAERMQHIVDALCARFTPDSVNLLAAHLTVVNGTFGGGERGAQSIFDYCVPATIFPITATYAALGHLHRCQEIPAACPTWYAGSPIQVDFGEGGVDKQVLLVDAEPGAPARVRPVPITSGWRLRTVHGTMADLRALAGTTADDRLRVQVTEPARVGLADEVRTIFPAAVDVQVLPPERDGAPTRLERRLGSGRSESELFAEFLTSRSEQDPALEALFARLLDEVHSEAGA